MYIIHPMMGELYTFDDRNLYNTSNDGGLYTFDDGGLYNKSNDDDLYNAFDDGVYIINPMMMI